MAKYLVRGLIFKGAGDGKFLVNGAILNTETSAEVADRTVDCLTTVRTRTENAAVVSRSRAVEATTKIRTRTENDCIVSRSTSIEATVQDTTLLSSGSSITFDVSGITSGNLLLAVIVKDDDVTTTDATGLWTRLAGFESLNAIWLDIWYKEALSSDESATSYTFDGDSEVYSGILYEIENADTTPVLLSSSADVGSDAAPLTGAFTAAEATSLILAGFGNDNVVTGQTLDSAITTTDVTSAGGTNGDIGIAVGQYLPGSTSIPAYTHSISGSEQWAAFVVEVKPSAGGDVNRVVDCLTTARTRIENNTVVSRSRAVEATTKIRTRTENNAVVSRSRAVEATTKIRTRTENNAVIGKSRSVESTSEVRTRATYQAIVTRSTTRTVDCITTSRTRTENVATVSRSRLVDSVTSSRNRTENSAAVSRSRSVDATTETRTRAENVTQVRRGIEDDFSGDLSRWTEYPDLNWGINGSDQLTGDGSVNNYGRLVFTAEDTGRVNNWAKVTLPNLVGGDTSPSLVLRCKIDGWAYHLTVTATTLTINSVFTDTFKQIVFSTDTLTWAAGDVVAAQVDGNTTAGVKFKVWKNPVGAGPNDWGPADFTEVQSDGVFIVGAIAGEYVGLAQLGLDESQLYDNFSGGASTDRFVIGTKLARARTTDNATIARSRVVDGVTSTRTRTTPQATVTHDVSRVVDCITTTRTRTTPQAVVSRSSIRIVDCITKVRTRTENTSTVSRSRIVNGTTVSRSRVITDAEINVSRIVNCAAASRTHTTYPAVVARGLDRTVNCIHSTRTRVTNSTIIYKSRTIECVTETRSRVVNPAVVRLSRLVNCLAKSRTRTTYPADITITEDRLVDCISTVRNRAVYQAVVDISGGGYVIDITSNVYTNLTSDVCTNLTSNIYTTLIMNKR